MEGHPTVSLREDQDPGEAYGAAKAAAERVVTAAFGERALVVRPGLIVGPHDPTDRFAYWPRRVARGGRTLAPGGPGHPAQFIDARTSPRGPWTLPSGACRAPSTRPGLPTTLGRLLETCQRVVTATTSELVWVSDQALPGAGVSPWMGVPLWVSAQGWEARANVVVDKALGAGLARSKRPSATPWPGTPPGEGRRSGRRG